MMRNKRVRLSYTAALLKLVIWSYLPLQVAGQSLPTRKSDYFNIDQKKLFYDTSRIPDGLEVSPYLYFNETKNYHFLLEEERPRVDITITPCASPLRWTVSYKPHRDTHYDINGVGPALRSRAAALLFTFSGEVSETFSLHQPRLGIYTVEIASVKTDSYVKIFASSSPDIDRYPELPSNTAIEVQNTKPRSLVVSWESSPDERHFGDDIEYCVAINRKRNYKTLCSLISHMEGDAKPTFPPNYGFGFAEEAYTKRLLRQKAKPIKGEKKGSIFFKCVGKETKFVYEKARKGRKYYVDVFVRNKQTQKSSQYKGVFVQTVGDKSISRLRDGKFKHVVFRKRKQNRTFKFRVRHVPGDLTVVVHTCAGSVDIEILKKRNGTLLNTKVTGYKTFTLTNVPPGKYLVKLSSSGKRGRTVSIMATAKSQKYRLPSLPEDTTVKVFENDNLTNCNSITIAWLGTDTRQEYCLYKTELKHSRRTRRFRMASYCDARQRRKSSHKILCKKFKHRNKDQAVLAITVTGLSPGTSYIFDVFVNVNKSPYEALHYNSVRTQTKTECRDDAIIQQ